MNYNNILFLDIETVSQKPTWEHLDEDWKDLWEAKARGLMRGSAEDTAASLYQKAAIYAEFGKVICISCGCIQGTGEGRKLVLKSYWGDDEKKLLSDFAAMLQSWSNQPDKYLCAHNGKEFDYPYLCRRMIINGIELPEALKISGRKPWEIRHLDTMEMWKFGEFKSFVSLKLLAKVFGVPSPKDDIDGSMVHSVYYNDGDIDRIVTYCQKDVITLAQVLLRFHCQEPIRAENISIKYTN